MHDRSLASQLVQALEDGLLPHKELPIEHNLRSLREVVQLLNLIQVLLHLVLRHLDQIENALQLLLDFLHLTAEWSGAALAIVW